MTRISKTRRISAVLATAALSLGGLVAAQPALAANDVIGPDDELFVNPQSTTLQAAATLDGQARADAQLLGSFASANWFTEGTPDQVRDEVAALVGAADATDEVPVLVAYNLPFRDCAQYSAGGAADTAAYTAWIDGLAAGIGDRDAVVILEPDGLGIIPWYTTINGELEWCQPAELDSATAASDRFVQLNHAVDALTALPNTAVYLDGTHSGWLGVGDITDRLIKAGVERADGFFLNASNYVQTERLQKYGTWISDCLNLSVNSWYEPAFCGSQYYPASPDDFSTWGLTDAAYDQAYADTGVTRDPAAQAHFVIDTSRNGQGPWTAPVGKYTDPEVWCNPPARGAGLTPTTETGEPLIDAYFWIKVPGESDGQCYRGTGGPEDPERGMIDPAAGQWFPEQARELVELAEPALPTQTCHVSFDVKGPLKGNFAATVRVRNTGTEPTGDWSLAWSFAGAETVHRALPGSFTQDGVEVAVTGSRSIQPGRTTVVALVGKTNGSTMSEPLLFTLDGSPCVSY
ncbi:endoglucanase [Diaminobutyricimonas aerilata]|uniref:Glucanase n=1 Tax=Diaminobutyricimonas aerilata TaxID=1162967 RepID=A0A2M9CJ86_9MICO|nr:glycoside hydrolase family 6 protein [Diaminobutyricimonas aerilata]PJJ71952.1 endoglucanase [Diaminobutyricimonas aerilata]